MLLRNIEAKTFLLNPTQEVKVLGSVEGREKKLLFFVVGGYSTFEFQII